MVIKNKSGIKESRVAAGLTQQDLSDLLGIPKRTIEDWERGVRQPPDYVERLIVDKIEQLPKAKN